MPGTTSLRTPTWGAGRSIRPAGRTGPASSVAAYVEQALSYQAAGWQGYKIHPFRIWRDDMRICRAVREAVGDGFPLMLDSTWGYDYPSALRVGKLIEELDFEWYEDPATEFPGAWYDSFAPWIYTT